MNIDQQLTEAAVAVDELFSDPADAAADYRRFLKLLDADEREGGERQERSGRSTALGPRSPGAQLNRDGRSPLLGSLQTAGTQTAQRAATSTVEQPRRAQHATGAAREKLAAELKRKYEAGATLRALAEEAGRSYGFVHRMLSEAGVSLRGRGGATRGRKASDIGDGA